MSSGFGLPRIDFSPLAQLGTQLAQAQRSRGMGDALQNNDYAAAAKVAFDGGDPDAGLSLMKLGQAYKTQQLQQAAGQEFSSGLSGLGFGGQSAPVGAAPQAAASRTVAPSFAGGATAMQMPRDGGEIEAKFVSALKDGGLTNPYGLAAMAAYASRESGYSPKNIAGSWSDPSESGQAGTSGGILSWRGDRFNNMRRQTAGAADPVVAQAKFAIVENPDLTLALQNAKSPEEANRLMADAWRFAGYNREGGENAARLNATRAYVAKLNGEAGVSQRQAAPAYAANEAETQALESRMGMNPSAVAEADLPAANAQNAEFQIPPGATVANQPVAAIAQSPLAQRIPFLLKAAANPNLPEPQRELSKTLLTRALDESKLPDEQKDYVLARSQGFSGTFIEYKRELKRAERDTGVTMSPGQERFERQADGSYRSVARVADRDKSNEGEAKLRGEFTKNLGSFTDVQDAYRRVIASTEQREADPTNVSPAADMSLIFGFMKMLDPGSVVREGEFASAQNAAGIPDRVRNAYNKALSGEFLQPEQRQGFIDQAGRLYGQARQGAESTATRYSDLAKGQGLDPSRVVQLPEAPRLPRVTKPNPAATAGSPRPGAPASAPAGAPPAGAVELLRSKPELRDAFEAKYGRGAADRALGVI